MNILVIKTGALGDVVRTSFIAQALKLKYKMKGAKIFWITDEKAIPLFKNNPYVEKVIPSNKKQHLKNTFFDIIVNLEEDEENTKFASSLKHKEIIGFIWENNQVKPTETAKEWFNMSALGPKPQNNILKAKNRKTHRQIIGEIVKVDYTKYEPFLRLTEKQRTFANNFLRRYNLSRTELIIGINTGSADRWPKQISIKKTAQLIDFLYKQFNAKILLFGGPNEVNRNMEILALTKSPVIATGCGNDLIEFPALISVCSLFITTDSLGLHIALALKRKTIVLIGPTSNAEIDMYGLGEKVIANSNCLCCYSKDCKSMEKINIEDIVKESKKLIKQKITLLITAFKEPNIKKAIESAIKQKTKWEYDIVISAPDEETLNIARSYEKKHKNIKIIKDPGKGKSYALNLVFSKIKTDILILTDGDVYISDNSVEDIANLFLDPEIGAVTGHPIPIENKKTKYGFWANFLFEAAHKLRKDAFDLNKFIECSGYLFAFRKEKVNKIPLDVAEDTVIPYFLWEKGYKIGYAEKAEVYVKNVDNLKDWFKQKIRTSKAHQKLWKYVDVNTTPRVKSFKNEARRISWVLKYPKTLNEMFWTFQLILARLIMWSKVIVDTKLKEDHYGDNWERIESTK